MVFLNRGGSPVPAEDAKISGDELTFMVGGTGQNRPTVTLRAAGNKLTGTVGQVKVAGERPPTWGACDANGSHAFGKPVTPVRRQVARRLGHPDEGQAPSCGRSKTAS